MAFDLIAAGGPYAPLADELMLFGRFVGAWDVASTWWDADGGARQQDGEWHFAWALGGRAVQDVLFAPRRRARPARHDAAGLRRAGRHVARQLVLPGARAVRAPGGAPRRRRHPDRGRDDGRAHPRALELRPHRAGELPLAGPLLGGRRRHLAAAAGDARDASAALTGAVQRRVAPVGAARRAVAARAVAGGVDERVLARVGAARAHAARAMLGDRRGQARDGGHRHALDHRRPVPRPHAEPQPVAPVQLHGRRDGQAARDGVEAPRELRRLARRDGGAQLAPQGATRLQVARGGGAVEVVLRQEALEVGDARQPLGVGGVGIAGVDEVERQHAGLPERAVLLVRVRVHSFLTTYGSTTTVSVLMVSTTYETSDLAQRVAALDAPSNLGLRPPAEGVAPGVYKLAGALNASLGDTHTLTHIEFLKTMQELKPNITVLLYAFNDIDYLAQVTPREGQSEHATSFFAAISPVRILFKNSFLFQSIYVRLRLLTYAPSPELSNPYENNALLNEHFRDLDRFVSLASTSSTLVTIVPFNIGVVASKDVGSDYNHFVKAATAHGLPIWPAGPEVFSGHAYKDLIVNMLDSHPNELAHQLLADRIADRVQVAMETHLQNQGPSEQ